MDLPNSSRASIKASSPSAATREVAIVGTTLQGTTPVPNVLFDTFLPRLSDTELRVLLVVNRATLGWKQGTGRKESDWLSHRQLQARTGRAGASVSHAIEALVRRGLLLVQDARGRARDSAHSRRATRGRLYYRLSDALLTPDQANSSEERGNHPPATATQSAIRTARGEEEGERGQARISTSPAPLQKLKTTKETGTKEKEKEAQMSSSKSEVTFPHNTSDGAEAAASEDALIDDPEEIEAEVERFVGVFARAYRLARPLEAVPPVEAADRTLLQGCLRHPGPIVLEAWLPAFFDSSFGYARRRGWSLECYLNCLFILQAQAGSNSPGKSTWQRAAGDGSGSN